MQSPRQLRPTKLPTLKATNHPWLVAEITPYCPRKGGGQLPVRLVLPLLFILTCPPPVREEEDAQNTSFWPSEDSNT